MWYTGPGGLTVGARVTSNYQKQVDSWDVGLVMAVRGPDPSAFTQVQGWAAVEDPRFPWADRPAMGLRSGLWMVDGTFRFTLRQKWDESPFRFANGERDTLTFAFNLTSPYARAWQDTVRWSNATVADVSAEWKWRSRRPALWFARGYLDGGIAFPRAGTPGEGAFGRAEIEGGGTIPLDASRRVALMLRGFGGISNATPPERSIGLSSLDPTATFDDNFLRGQDAILVLPGVPYVPLGGAGMRGFSLYNFMVNVVLAEHAARVRAHAAHAGVARARTAGRALRRRGVRHDAWLNGGRGSTVILMRARARSCAARCTIAATCCGSTCRCT